MISRFEKISQRMISHFSSLAAIFGKMFSEREDFPSDLFMWFLVVHAGACAFRMEDTSAQRRTQFPVALGWAPGSRIRTGLKEENTK